MAKRSTPSSKKPAKKKAAAAKKPVAKKAASAKGVAAKKAASKKAPAKKAPAKKAPAKKAPAKKAPAKKATAARKAPAGKAPAAKKPAARKSAPARAAAPARKPAATRKPGRARRAAAAMKSAAKAVAAVVGAPVKAVAAVVAGPVVESPPERQGDIEPVEEEEPHDGASNGVDALSVDDDVSEASLADEGEGGADPDDLIDRIESAYGVTLPDRYRRFLREGEYQRYPRIELAGYIRGPYDLDFVDELLPDVAELGQNAGIYDMDDVPWSNDYAGYVPLASLSHPEVDEPKVFLVHQVRGDRHRVLLFDYEGWRLYPLADSFDGFLAGLPMATNDISTAFRPGA